MHTCNLEENNIESLKQPMRLEMSKAITHLEHEISKLRTGRAHTSLIEDVPVVCYDQQTMPLKAIASIAAPEPRLLTIQAWDKGVLGSIEKAIQISGLGLVPINNGEMIRIQIPEMSTSRRDELVKVLGKKVEECKISIRNVRKDFNNSIKTAKANKTISENFFNRLNDVLQEVTDTFCKQADTIGKKKHDEIMHV